ncbi:MAG: hypothetical protein M0R06_00690 [Sphaerochaeta sp.]|jgi:hypothetical protein|nr:hypothetical protein [Sphaerochaeta sp.]
MGCAKATEAIKVIMDPYAGSPTHVSEVDRFDDSDIDTGMWSKNEVNRTHINETGGVLQFENSGVGGAGISYVQTTFPWGNYATIEVQIQVVDGETGGDGEHCEASLVLYKDADNYVKWGIYRDTSEAVNSSGYLRYNIGGAGESAVDLTSAVVDNAQHAFKIAKFENQIEVYYDGTYKTGFSFQDLANYYTRLEGGTGDNTDVMDVSFDDMKMYNLVDPFGTDLTGVTATLATIQGYVDDLESRLTTVRAGYIDALANYNVSTGSGTLQLTNTDAGYIEFTTASYGTVFELTLIADLDATNGFDTNAAASTILEITIYKEYAGVYGALPQDIWAVQKDVTLTRNVDIDHVRCGEDTKIGFQLDKVPSGTVNIPYRWIVRRLKT